MMWFQNSRRARAVAKIVGDAGLKRTPEAESQLAKAGLSPEQITEAYQMFEFAMNRAFFESIGAVHATADYDLDPVFRASLKLARDRFPGSGAPTAEKVLATLVWWIAVPIGVVAAGLIVYSLVSLLRISSTR
jgi:hypothetical protein